MNGLRNIEKGRNLSKWKYAVGAVICVTFSVTISAYVVLRREEEAKFRTAFSQFSRTLGDAALNHQHDLKHALAMLSDGATIAAANANATWPFFWWRGFESYAENFRTISQAEIIAVNNIVAKGEREAYTHWSQEHYQEWIEEGHMIAHGNLNLLDNDTAKFNPYISRRNPAGEFVEDDEREFYVVRTTLSPPPRAYGPVTNWNINSVPTTADSTAKLLEWKNQTIFSQSRPLQALPLEEHATLHTDPSLDHPHTFVFAPVYEKLHNTESKIVGMTTAVVAWDTSMLHLLPSNVRGIFCVIKNSCGQTYSYGKSTQNVKRSQSSQSCTPRNQWR